MKQLYLGKMSKKIQTSRRLSYLLRHNPDDLVMDKEGWVLISDLLLKLNITFDLLDDIIVNNDKKRFAYNGNKTKIRASQGHSHKLKIDIKFDEVQFPKTYYHGTALMNVDSIMAHGLSPKNRTHVHLSQNIETAKQVGSRHSIKVVVLAIDGNQMKRDGLKLYKSENNVFLVDYVPYKYITILN